MHQQPETEPQTLYREQRFENDGIDLAGGNMGAT